MPSYNVPCDCGNALKVELFQAGTELVCPTCRRMVTIPSSLTLQSMANERHPHMSAVDKLRTALNERETPFDGTCQRCRERPAEISRAITWDFLTERIIAGDQGLQPSLRGVNLVVAEAEEHWESIRFPLLHCQRCDDEFRQEWSRSWWTQLGINVLLAIFAGPLVLMSVLLFVAMPFVSAVAIILVVIMYAKFLGRKKVSTYIQKVLTELPVVSTAIQQEDEYRIAVGGPEPLSP